MCASSSQCVTFCRCQPCSVCTEKHAYLSERVISALLCVVRRYDPSGPIQVGDTWYVFADGASVHWESKDLLRWKAVQPGWFSGLTGSITRTPSGLHALYVDNSGMMRRTARGLNLSAWSAEQPVSHSGVAGGIGVPRRAPPRAAPRRRRFGEAALTSGDAGGSNSRFGGMAARTSHWGAGGAAGLYLALGDEAEVPVPLVGSDALVAPRPATARSVTRQRAVGSLSALN